MASIKNIDWKLTSFFELYIEKLAARPECAAMVAQYHKLEAEGWRFYVVDSSRGRCYTGRKIISLPKWAMKRGKDYWLWYVAHELAHTMAPHDCHGLDFMAALKKICPPDSIAYELTYKPRNAAAAGIACFEGI